MKDISLERLSVPGTGVPFLLHGGAGPADPTGERAQRAALEIKKISEEVSRRDFSSLPKFLETTEVSEPARICLEGVKKLEAHPEFNAGRGASLQEDGRARLSASFIDSKRGKFSAVINVEQILHPSELVMKLQGERFSILDSDGAEKFARRLGVELAELRTKERLEKWMKSTLKKLEGGEEVGKFGTVGAVAFSERDGFAALTSTGGVGNEPAGRVGDSPTVAGNYATAYGAVSCTGIGEQIIALAVSPRILFSVEQGRTLEEAVQEVLTLGQKRGFQFALIALAQRNGKLEAVRGSVGSHLTSAFGTA